MIFQSRLTHRPGAGTVAAIVLGAIVTLAEAGGASAGPLPPFDTPGAAVCESLRDAATMPGFWLGHFSGGRILSIASGERAVDWRNDYTCFASLRSCNSWRSQERRVYRRIQGYTTCLRIR